MLGMSVPAEKLTQAENLIQAGYKQEAALLLRTILQTDQENWRAWNLLSQVTSGSAQELCLQKAASLKNMLGDETMPYEPVKTELDTPVQPLVAATSPQVPRLVEEKSPVQRTNAQEKSPASTEAVSSGREGSRLRYWSSIAISGILLGCLAIFLINLFAPSFNGQNNASAENEPAAIDTSMVAAVFETATPTEVPLEEVANDEADAESQVEELLPTNTPAAIAKVIGENGEPRDAWTPTPTPTNTPSPTPTIEPTRLVDNGNTSFPLPAIASGERWVDVNLTLQTLTAYEGNSPVFQTIISSGRPPYYTVTGQFRVYYRLEEQTMDGRRLGFNYVTPGVPHVQYFYGDFAIHGAYWHNDFGTPVSHGCVNVTPADAEWLYNWMSYGTLVNVHY